MTMWISPVTECQTILDFAAAWDGVSGDSYNYETCADHMHLAPAKSSPPTANFYTGQTPVLHARQPTVSDGNR